VNHRPGLDPERYSGTNDFYTDANLNQRARPASYADFAPLPGEATSALLGSGEMGSPALQAHVAAGGALTPLSLAEIEVDEGGRSADLAQPAPPQFTTAPAPAAVDNDRLTRLEQNLERLTNLLLGDK
jgi:hypothetical protein